MSVGLRNAWRLLTKSAERKRKARCGHFTKMTGECNVFGKIIPIKLSPKHRHDPEFCIDCIAAMAVPCAWCGKPILICEEITLYKPSNTRTPLENAVRSRENPDRYIGCYGFNCTIPGVLPDGYLDRDQRISQFRPERVIR